MQEPLFEVPGPTQPSSAPPPGTQPFLKGEKVQYLTPAEAGQMVDAILARPETKAALERYDELHKLPKFTTDQEAEYRYIMDNFLTDIYQLEDIRDSPYTEWPES